MPVSSSAQLTLLPWLLGWRAEEDRTTFAASLHAGSAVGISLAMINGIRKGATGPASTYADSVDQGGWGTAKRSLLFAAPAAVAGLLGQGVVEKRLGGIRATASLLAGAGLAMWAADLRPSDRPLSNQALNVAALAQVAALAPGVSRSGATMTALRAQRVDRDVALRYSLHSSLPIAIGAAGLTAIRARRLPPLLPSAAAATAAFGTTKAVQGRARHLLPAAAAYRLLVAAVVLGRSVQERARHRPDLR